MLQLVEQGATIDLGDHEGRTALMWAAIRARPEALSVLLHCGADPSLCMSGGTSVIQLAESESSRGHRRERCLALLNGECPLFKLPAEAEAEAAAEREAAAAAAAATAAAATAAAETHRAESSAESRAKRARPVAAMARCGRCDVKYESSAAVRCLRCLALGCPSCAQRQPDESSSSAHDGGHYSSMSARAAAAEGPELLSVALVLCGSCVASYTEAEAKLLELCAAGSVDLDWAAVVQLLSSEADAVRGTALLPVLQRALRSDDAELVSLLLAASCRQPLRLTDHIMQLLSEAAQRNAAVCALLLSNRMISPQAKLVPAAAEAPTPNAQLQMPPRSSEAAAATSALQNAPTSTAVGAGMSIAATPDDTGPAIGSRVRVFWPAEQAWFAGNVERAIVQDGRRIYHVAYDDGQSEWRELGVARWELLPTAALATAAARTPSASTATRVAASPSHSLQRKVAFRYMHVDPAFDLRVLREMALRAAEDPSKQSVARALALGLRRAHDALATSQPIQESLPATHYGSSKAERLAAKEVVTDEVLAALWNDAAPPGALGSPVATRGDDISDGAEALPVPWENSTGDGAQPPKFLYLRQCIAGDAHATVELVRKPAKRCRGGEGQGQHGGAPQGPQTECSPWCPLPSSEVARQRGHRSLQRGIRYRLQVFRKGAQVGWGVRTHDPIPKGAFIFEYVGEHCSRIIGEARSQFYPETDVFLMEIGKGFRNSGFAIDALHARNVSAFANFACFPNMRKGPMLAKHWDARLPHAAFIATRNIAAGEELTYRRDDSATSSQRAAASRVRCLCGAWDCRKWV